MGRKRIPKNQRREVISISLKPSTIDLIDNAISHSQSRSVFLENIIIKHLQAVKQSSSGDYMIRDYWDCLKCDIGYSKLQPNNGLMLCKKCGTFLEISASLKEEF